MMQIRKSGERGRLTHGWLETFHAFSFGTYHDPDHMGFRTLRVLNEDWIQAGKGFPSHPHRDMEILTYILEGELEHEDSMGSGSVIGPEEVQRMSAGTGVVHSERNPSQILDVHLLQIWILPEHRGTAPGYEQKRFPREEKRGRLRLIASPNGNAGSITVGQDVELYAVILGSTETVTHTQKTGRSAWVQVAAGAVRVGNHLLSQGDGAAISDAGEIVLVGTEPESEILVFDLA